VRYTFLAIVLAVSTPEVDNCGIQKPEAVKLRQAVEKDGINACIERGGVPIYGDATWGSEVYLTLKDCKFPCERPAPLPDTVEKK
jgi:hypothetical protein